MPTQILDPKQHPELQPAGSLWPLYQPEQAPLRFQAETTAEAHTWQQTVRAELAQTIGFQDWPDVPFEPETIESIDKGDYVRHKLLIWVGPSARMPVYLLVPKNAQGPLATVLAFHGHGYGVKDIVGLWENGEERGTPDGYHKDFAVALCRSGFLVAAPEISCFGERQTDFSYLNTTMGQPVPTTCQHTSMLAFHLGGSTVGLRVREARRLLDYLTTLPEVELESHRRNGHLRRRHAHLFLNLSGRAHPRLRGQRLLLHLPRQHPGDGSLLVQLCARAAPLR